MTLQKKQAVGEERIVIIEVMRLLFAAVVVLFHASVLRQPEGFFIMPKGYIGVEFFFLLSGFLMARSAAESYSQNKETPVGAATVHFIKRKVLSFYPYYLFAFFVTFLIYPNIFKGPLNSFLLRCEEALWELLLVKRVGVGNGVWLNGATWYLSAMVFCMFLIYPLLYKTRDIFVHIIAPVLVVFILGLLYAEGGLSITGKWFPQHYRSLLRAFAELSMGCVCFEICCNLQKQIPGTTKRMLFTIAELLCYLTALAFAAFWKGDMRMDYFILLVLAVGITISFSGLSYFYEKKAGAFTGFWGKYSLCLYLCHRGWCWFLKNKIPRGGDTGKLFLYVLLSTCTALACMITVDGIKCILNKNGRES